LSLKPKILSPLLDDRDQVIENLNNAVSKVELEVPHYNEWNIKENSYFLFSGHSEKIRERYDFLGFKKARLGVYGSGYYFTSDVSLALDYALLWSYKKHDVSLKNMIIMVVQIPKTIKLFNLVNNGSEYFDWLDKKNLSKKANGTFYYLEDFCLEHKYDGVVVSYGGDSEYIFYNKNILHLSTMAEVPLPEE
jgi:hypothetical protein